MTPQPGGSVTTREHEMALREHLTSLRRDWPKPDVRPDRTRGSLGATVLIRAAQMTRMAIQQDLTFWTHAALNGNNACLPAPDVPPDPADVVATCRYLLPHARLLSGWEYAGRMENELAAHARALRHLTHDPGLLLTSACPVELLGPDNERAPCGAEVRAHLDQPSDVRCPGCATTDTIEGWQRRIVGTELVTADELAKRLIWLGRRVQPDTIRKWAERGIIPHAVEVGPQGRSLYDPARTMRALMAREDQQRVSA